MYIIAIGMYSEYCCMYLQYNALWLAHQVPLSSSFQSVLRGCASRRFFLLHSVRGLLIFHLQHLRHGPQQRCVASPDAAWRDDARASTPAHLVSPHAFPHPQLTPAASAASTRSSFTHTGAKIEFDPVEKGKGPGHQVKGSPMSKSANADAWRRTFEDSPGLVSSMWLKKVCAVVQPILYPFHQCSPSLYIPARQSFTTEWTTKTDHLSPSRAPVSLSLSLLSLSSLLL